MKSKKVLFRISFLFLALLTFNACTATSLEEEKGNHEQDIYQTGKDEIEER